MPKSNKNHPFRKSKWALFFAPLIFIVICFSVINNVNHKTISKDFIITTLDNESCYEVVSKVNIPELTPENKWVALADTPVISDLKLPLSLFDTQLCASVETKIEGVKIDNFIKLFVESHSENENKKELIDCLPNDFKIGEKIVISYTIDNHCPIDYQSDLQKLGIKKNGQMEITYSFEYKYKVELFLFLAAVACSLSWSMIILAINTLEKLKLLK